MNVMLKQVSEVRHGLEMAFATHLWHQWGAVGGAVYGGLYETRHPVDLEALILASTWCFDQEEPISGLFQPRLASVVRNWMAARASMLAIGRMKRLQHQFELAIPKSLSDLGLWAGRFIHSSWNVFVTEGGALETASEWSLNETRSAGVLSRSEATLILTLRQFFGVSARAETFAWLLCESEGHPALIAREVHWLPKTIQLILNELAESGVVWRDRNGKSKVFGLPGDPWRTTFSVGDARWRNQAAYFSLIQYVVLFLREVENQTGQSAGYLEIRLMETVEEIGRRLSRANLFCQELQDLVRELLRGRSLITLEDFSEICRNLVRSLEG